MVTLDQLVPKDHLLRKIDSAIDFSFIHDLTAPLYCADNGRPPLDPTLMFKALFIGYLFGVRSERQLVREIEVNVAYRWFLRLKLTDTVFDASTLSQNRRRRYRDETIAQSIFDRIVEQALGAGLVDGTVLYTDSTHLKANANKAKLDLEVVSKSRADYWDDLDRAIEADRAAHGRKPLKDKQRQPPEKETKVSRTDPDSGYMVRDGKPKGFFYLDHRWTPRTPSSPTRSRRLPTCMTVSSISAGSTARWSASACVSQPSVSTPAMRRPASPGDWRSARSGASPATATRRHPGPA